MGIEVDTLGVRRANAPPLSSYRRGSVSAALRTLRSPAAREAGTQALEDGI